MLKNTVQVALKIQGDEYLSYYGNFTDEAFAAQTRLRAFAECESTVGGKFEHHAVKQNRAGKEYEIDD